ncbi:hypothetical protein [Amycolatopsis nalaikhensis]|uniref:Uncharacterized protein n=1 Tax=Amycolatopsis nalaikhensis TaxID=715472 RepID=A0ABY8XET0_9PSEU|nr:hypothetical protein [Amycolatopsis sp. 2-2]WIV54133.1 hypothetical protein QP939_35435 [Amycolatopsis sp. 2-2]
MNGIEPERDTVSGILPPPAMPAWYGALMPSTYRARSATGLASEQNGEEDHPWGKPEGNGGRRG